MKNYRRGKSIVWLSCVLVLTSMLIAPSGCICGRTITDIIIENQTDQVLTIYYKDTARIGDVGPGQKITISVDGSFGEYILTAKNAQGEVVFSQVYSFTTNLEKIDGRTYKGVIPPLLSN